MGRLHRANSDSDGLSRRRHGRGFTYLDTRGRRVDDTTVERIKSLAIPPAWEDVWICSDPDGNLQATGTDVAGRRQYLYHPRWRTRRDRQKFDRMREFARSLPRLRRTVTRDLGTTDLGHDRVLACAVRLLDRGLFRIGSEEYADANGSFGLTTLERRHVTVGRGGQLGFDFVGKGGVRNTRTVVDPDVHSVIAALKNRRSRSARLLVHRNGGSGWSEIRSEDVNAYLKEAAGGEFSAKDFRTWHATVLTAVAIAGTERPTSERGRKRVIAAAVADVADQLGNTPAVCRASYIDPLVFDRWLEGETISTALDFDGLDAAAPARRRRVETSVLRLLEGG